MRLGEEMIAKTVCRHAVKANDPLRYPEVEKLIRDLLDCDPPLLLSAWAPNNDPDFASSNWKKNSAAKCNRWAPERSLLL